jgi:hypothetical protein
MLACLLLCLMPEDCAFWLLCSIVEQLRLPDFYTREPASMFGYTVECKALNYLSMQVCNNFFLENFFVLLLSLEMQLMYSV